MAERRAQRLSTYGRRLLISCGRSRTWRRNKNNLTLYSRTSTVITSQILDCLSDLLFSL